MDHYFSGRRQGGGERMRNIEKKCLQDLKRQNKLLENTIYIKKCLQRRQIQY